MLLPLKDNQKDLLPRVAKGDEKAFAELFHIYHGQLAEFIMMLTRSTELTEEIVQDIFVKVWLKRTTLGKVERFESWLFIITRNYTLNCLRNLAHQKKREREISSGVQTSEAGSESDPNRDIQYLDLLERAIAQLPPRQQEVFMLSRKEGISHEEIAKRLGIKYSTVKKSIQWANRSISRFVKAHAKVVLILLIVSGSIR